MKHVLLVLMVGLFTSCASIPQKSVELSAEIGVGIQKQYQSQIELVNLHFSTKRQLLDEAEKRAIDVYLKGVTPGIIGFVKDEGNQDSLDEALPKMLGGVAIDVAKLSAKNNEVKEEFEKTRLILVKQLTDNYLILNQANSSVTGLLQSAVKVKKARSEAFSALSEATDGEVDLEKVFAELDDFLLKGGEEAGKIIKLSEKVKKIINKEEEE